MRAVLKRPCASRIFTGKAAADAWRLLSQSELDRGFICVPIGWSGNPDGFTRAGTVVWRKQSFRQAQLAVYTPRGILQVPPGVYCSEYKVEAPV